MKTIHWMYKMFRAVTMYYYFSLIIKNYSHARFVLRFAFRLLFNKIQNPHHLKMLITNVNPIRIKK